MKDRQSGLTPVNEIMLRHLTQDEALPLLDKFLHDSYLANMPQVRIVHGKGTGTLRMMVLRYISGHPLVKSHRPAMPWEGGGGVTVAELS